jgi:hypothetical protein
MKKYRKIYKVSLQKLSRMQTGGVLDRKKIDLIESELKEPPRAKIRNLTALLNQAQVIQECRNQ